MSDDDAPDYAKPDSPGVHMGFDNTVAVYHVVVPDDSFETAATDIMALLRSRLRTAFPTGPGRSTSTSSGTRATRSASTPDFYEYQQDFWFSGRWPRSQTAFETPITGGFGQPRPAAQRRPRTSCGSATTRAPHSGQVLAGPLTQIRRRRRSSGGSAAEHVCEPGKRDEPNDVGRGPACRRCRRRRRPSARRRRRALRASDAV